MFGITDAENIVKVYGEDVGKFVIIKFIDPDQDVILRAYGILTGFTQFGHLIIKGNDGQTRHIDPKDIKNYHAKPDRYGLNGGDGNY